SIIGREGEQTFESANRSDAISGKHRSAVQSIECGAIVRSELQDALVNIDGTAIGKCVLDERRFTPQRTELRTGGRVKRDQALERVCETRCFVFRCTKHRAKRSDRSFITGLWRLLFQSRAHTSATCEKPRFVGSVFECFRVPLVRR